jgi:LysR family transcriptional regulator, transcriptional activator of the cysJI operon
MFDFRLKVFYTVARRLNFTRAAEELFITQPAVTKHIHEIEAYYKTQLFERNGTRIKLTPAGAALLEHTEQLFTIYRNIEFDLAAMNEHVQGTIRLGASTTVAQYVLPKYLASFKQKFPDINMALTASNTEHIENALIANKIDFGIIEGQSKRPQLKYTSFLKDEMVLCTRTGNPAIKKQTISLSALKELPLLMREQGSGSQEVIAAALKKAGIRLSQLNIEMVLESTESIKTYLGSSDKFCFFVGTLYSERIKEQ